MTRFRTLAAALALVSFGTLQANAVAAAQDPTPILLPSQSSVYNQTSVNLPAAPVAYGQDLVRAADGVSCQSAIGSGGPYVDIGVTRSTDVFDRGSQAVYGRIVMPIGRRPRRVDCTKLYELEIARMRLEMELLRMGAATTPLAPLAISPLSTGPVPDRAPAKTEAQPRPVIEPVTEDPRAPISAARPRPPNVQPAGGTPEPVRIARARQRGLR